MKLLKTLLVLLMVSTVAYAGNVTNLPVEFGGSSQAGGSSNCELSISGTTLTIGGADGYSCQVGYKDSTSGTMKSATMANTTLTFGASSDTDGNLFGITDANWASAMPIFIGVITDGATPLFTISRVPLRVSGSGTTDICDKGDTDCDAQGDAMIIGDSVTLANYTSKPITQVAWLQGTYATTGGAWTYTLNASSGFNNDYKSIIWTMPTAQMGAASSSHFNVNGGTTVASFTTNKYYYTIDSNGYVKISVFFDGDAGTDGNGAVSAIMSAPYASASTDFFLTSTMVILEPTNSAHYVMPYMSNASSNIYFVESNENQSRWNDYSNGGRSIYGGFQYKSL